MKITPQHWVSSDFLMIHCVFHWNRYCIWTEMTIMEEPRLLLTLCRLFLICIYILHLHFCFREILLSSCHLIYLSICFVFWFFLSNFIFLLYSFGSVSREMTSLKNNWVQAESTMLIWYLRYLEFYATFYYQCDILML